jgi:hypothetical protein
MKFLLASLRFNMTVAGRMGRHCHGRGLPLLKDPRNWKTSTVAKAFTLNRTAGPLEDPSS